MTKDCFIRGFFDLHAGKITKNCDGCWVWTGAKTGFGHGAVTTGARVTMAHRAAYEAAHGEGKARGSMVLHSCHNPACVNPSHLSLGDHSENMRQMREAGRSVAGEKQVMAKLNNEKVVAIRRRIGSGETLMALAVEYGVTHQVIKKAATGQTWRHIPGEVKPQSIRLGKGAAQILTAEDAKAIRRDLDGGCSKKAISASYGISLSTVYAISAGRIWGAAA